MDDKDKEIMQLRLSLEIASMTIDVLTRVLKEYKRREEKQLEVSKS